MVGAHLERLFAPHNETNLVRLFVLEQSRVARPSFLPFVRIRTESEELCAPGREKKRRSKGCLKKLNVTGIGGEGHVQLEDYGLVLFIGLRHNLFCELDDGFKVGIMLILRLRQLSAVHCAGQDAGWGRGVRGERKCGPLVLKDSSWSRP